MPTKSALQSKGVWGSAIAFAAGLISYVHTLNLVGFAQAVADNWPSIVTMGGGILAGIGRIRANTFIAPADPIKARAALGLLLAGCLSLGLGSCSQFGQGTNGAQVQASALNLVKATATSEAATLALDYLQHGSINYKADLISGALSQVRTLEGTASPLSIDLIRQAVGYVIPQPGLRADVTDAAIRTLNQGIAGGLNKDTAIETGLTLLDQSVQRYLATHKSA